MRTVYLHVGAQKTGTTWLQERVFPELKGLHYVPHKPRLERPPPDGIIGSLGRIAHRGPLLLDLDAERRELAARLEEIAASTVLISNERLFGSMFFHFYDGDHIADSLRAVFPSARVILVVRRQDDLLEALYRQCLRVFLHPTVDGFLGFRDGGFGTSLDFMTHPAVNPRQLDLHRIVGRYVSRFGREHVLVLPYELLRADRRAFLERLCAFMGVEPVHPDNHHVVNRSYSALSARAAFVLNRFVRAEWTGRDPLRLIPHQPLSPYLRRRPDGRLTRALNGLNRRLSLPWFLDHVVDRTVYVKGSLIDERRRRLIMDLHRDSNRRLDADLDLGLASYGYY